MRKIKKQINCQQEEVCILQERKPGQKLRCSFFWTPGIEGSRGQRGKVVPRGSLGKKAKSPQGVSGESGKSFPMEEEGAEQEPAELFVGRGWVSALVLTRSWALSNKSCRWKSSVLCPGVRLQVTWYAASFCLFVLGEIH